MSGYPLKCYLCKTFHSDDLTLKQAGVYGSIYKVILGSKSFNPCVRREDAAPVPNITGYSSALHGSLDYEFGDFYTKEDRRDLGYSMWWVSEYAGLNLDLCFVG